MSSLPKSIEAARKAYAEGSQYPWEAFSVTPNPLKYSDAHLARSRSLSPELNASSPPPSPPEGLQLDCLRSDSLGESLNTSSSPSGTECLEPGELWAADYLPPGWKVLPKCCYNYELFEPPPPPPVLPCSRAWLYSQIVSTSRPVFLSCNLTNPIHLASIISFGENWSFTEEVADHMVPAGYYEYVEELQAWNRVSGVLICGLTLAAMHLLDNCMKNRQERYERSMEDVTVETEDGEEVEVAAYMYRKA